MIKANITYANLHKTILILNIKFVPLRNSKISTKILCFVILVFKKINGIENTAKKNVSYNPIISIKENIDKYCSNNIFFERLSLIANNIYFTNFKEAKI